MTKTNETAYAHLLGVAAFTEEKLCVPALDAELCKMLAGKKPGEGTPLLKAWLKGWHDANLLAD